MSCQTNLNLNLNLPPTPNKKMPSGGKSSLISEMEQRVSRMVKLIEEDADSFAKKAEMYYEKRPEMISLVEEFHRMYRTLAERYENCEFRKSNATAPPFDVLSQSELGSEPPSSMPSPDRRLSRSSTMPSPEMRLSRRSSGPRAPGFEFFLGNGNGSDFRDGDESSTLDYESGSDDFSVKNYCINEESMYESEAEVVDPMSKIQPYDEEVASLRQEIRDKEMLVKKLEEQLKSCQEEVSNWKYQHGKEQQEATKRLSMCKTTLQERDQEIKGLKEAMSKVDVSLLKENKRLKEELRKISKEKTFMEDHVKELELRCRNIEEQVRHAAKARRHENEWLMADKCVTELTKTVVMLQLAHDMLMAEKDDLSVELSSRDDVIDRMNEHVRQLRVELMAVRERARKSGEEIMVRVRELEREVEKKQRMIMEAEGERQEAIRQLRVSLEHYRKGYHGLRQVMMGNKIPPDMAWSET